MRRRTTTLPALLLGLALFSPSGARAQQPQPQPAPQPPKGAPAPAPKGAPAAPAAPATAVPEIKYERYSLPNGLEVITHRDAKLPVVAVNVWYHVGAFHEQPGRTGFAHLFEHMMFQGSKHVADDVHLGMLEKLGATDLNGTTNFDRTNYFETVPSHHLETALWLESDRMGFLLDALTAEKLKTQQEVVKNERRQGREAAPYGLADEKVWQALFPLPHPYHGQVIGSMNDLEAATDADVRGFFTRWYAPANATLTIVGDFEPARARALVEKYFGSLPSGPKPAAPKVERVKVAQEVVIRHDEPVATLPALFLGWLTPAIFEPGDAEADVLATSLATGKASRLHRRLVHEKQLAQSVTANQQSLGHQSAFQIQVVARPGVSTDALRREVDAVLDEVRKGGLTAAEIARARNRYDTQVVSGLQRVGGFGGKADVLQHYNHYVGDPGYLGKDLARYAQVTPESVKRFVAEHLRPDARVVLHAVPPAEKAAAAPGQAKAPPGAPAKPAAPAAPKGGT
ncbi:MAG TPA: pitrilysin family protein [Polyangiaceae bacterium]|nr:pitrilysin family protein [Polyangiaceae bacterium]